MTQECFSKLSILNIESDNIIDVEIILKSLTKYKILLSWSLGGAVCGDLYSLHCNIVLTTLYNSRWQMYIPPLLIKMKKRFLNYILGFDVSFM